MSKAKIVFQKTVKVTILLVLVPVSAVMLILDPTCRALNAARKVFLNEIEDQFGQVVKTYKRILDLKVPAELEDEPKIEEYGI